MTNKTNLGLVAWAQKMLGQPYWFGSCSYKATASLLNSKAKQYLQHYTAARMSRYKADIAKGAIVSDCSGLIKGYYWTRDDGVQVYGLDGRPDKGANGMLEAATVKGTIDTLPEVPGLLLHYSGHVGVYIGNGYAIEARGFDYGIVKTKVKDRKWTHWCRCRYIDYVDNAAPAPVEPDKKPEAPATTAPDTGDAPLNLGTRVLSYKKGVKLMSGEDVRNVQKRLIQLGYNPGAADGMFGAKTEAAVRLFQTHAVIAIDGKVGQVTRLALLKK